MIIDQVKQVSEGARPGRSKVGMVGRLLTWTLAMALAVIALFWLSRIGAIAFSFITINEQVGEVRALPSGTVTTLSLLLSVLFVTLGGAALYFLFTGFRFGQAVLALATLAALQFAINAIIDHFAQPRQIALESMGSRAFFDRKGNSLVWYVKEAGESCPAIFDAPGFHPNTREKLKPITSEVAQTIQTCLAAQKKIKQQKELLASRRGNGLTPVMITHPIDSVSFFDPTSGDPMVWVSKNKDCFDLFRNGEGGYHPVTRNPLVPVDARLAKEIRSCKKRAEILRLRAEGEKNAEEQTAAEVARQESQRAAADAAKQEAARLAAIEVANRESIRARPAQLASESAMAPQSAPVKFKLVNHDCMSVDFYLNNTFLGRVGPDGGTSELLVAPGSYIGRVCLSQYPSKCLGQKSEVLVPGSNVTRRVGRHPSCPVAQL